MAGIGQSSAASNRAEVGAERRRSRLALVLAAGLSERMGVPKATLRWGEGSLLEFQLAQLRAAGVPRPVVVLGHAAERVRALLPADASVRWVYNSDYRSGRGSSVRAGAGALEDGGSSVLVTSVDQPCPSEVMELLYRAADSGRGLVYVPTFRGRRGHPVVFAGELLAELRAVTEVEEGLRAVVRRHAPDTVEVPVEWEGVVWNLNRREDYLRAHQAFFSVRPEDLAGR